MATFRRIEDDSLDDELMADIGKSSNSSAKKTEDNFVDLDINPPPSPVERFTRQNVNNSEPKIEQKTEQKTNFKRIEDDSLDDELQANAPNAGENKVSSPLVIDSDKLNSNISVGESILQKDDQSLPATDPPKKSSKSPVGIIAVVVILFVIVGLFFAFKGFKNEKPVFLITYTCKDPSIKVFLNGLEPSVENQAGIYSIKLDKGQASSLIFKKDGYKDKKFDVDTSTDLSKDLGEIVLEKKIPKNTLFFTCKEPDVEIVFDNEKKDVKEKDGLYTLSNIAEGKHSIALKKVGFKTINKDFEMSKDEGIELGSLELQITDFKRLEIEVSPLDVEVFIDGEKVKTERKGNSLRTDYLEPKTVCVEIRAKGFKPYKNEKFEIYSDISNFMGPITLEKIVEKKSENKKKEDKKK